jgi:predicted enzyme related to lactoylglutathione lyase
MATIHRSRRAALAAMVTVAGGAAAQTLPWPAVGEPSASARTAGRWLWADLLTADAVRASDFYAVVFGWNVALNAAGYRTVRAGGRAIGGIVPAAGNRGARWIPLASGDPATMAQRARERGGAVLSGPRAVAGRGQLALLADPEGALFGVLLADGGDPADHAGADGEWLWLELWAREPGPTANFYRDVFGYAVSAADARTANAYLLSAGGRARAGVMALPDASLSPAWVPYVRVADVGATLARARTAGARVVVAPRAHFRSQLAVLADPQGAPFAIANWRPE